MNDFDLNKSMSVVTPLTETHQILVRSNGIDIGTLSDVSNVVPNVRSKIVTVTNFILGKNDLPYGGTTKISAEVRTYGNFAKKDTSYNKLKNVVYNALESYTSKMFNLKSVIGVEIKSLSAFNVTMSDLLSYTMRATLTESEETGTIDLGDIFKIYCCTAASFYDTLGLICNSIYDDQAEYKNSSEVSKSLRNDIKDLYAETTVTTSRVAAVKDYLISTDIYGRGEISASSTIQTNINNVVSYAIETESQDDDFLNEIVIDIRNAITNGVTKDEYIEGFTTLCDNVYSLLRVAVAIGFNNACKNVTTSIIVGNDNRER